jgi:tetratricopeptide (TPR) repeat protein
VEGYKKRPSHLLSVAHSGSISSYIKNGPKRPLKYLASFPKSTYSKTKLFYKSHKLISLIIAAVLLIALVFVAVLIYHNATTRIVSNKTSETLSKYKEQLPSLKKATGSKPNDATTHKNYAVALYATGDLSGAATQYQDAINVNPKDASAYNNLANTYRDLHNYSKAVDAYNKSIELNPKAINAYVNLANVQTYNLNEINDAITTYKKSLVALPNNTQLEFLLGMVYEDKGDIASAKSTYNIILSQDANNAAAKSRLEALK